MCLNKWTLQDFWFLIAVKSPLWSSWTWYRLIGGCRRLGEWDCFGVSYSKGILFLRNVSTNPLIFTVSKPRRSQYEILVELLSTHKIMSSDVQNSAECKCKGKSRIRHWNRHRPLPFTSSPWTPPTFTLRRILTVLFPYSVLTGWSLLCSRSVSCEVTMEYYSKNFPDCCPQVSMYRAFLVFLSLQANAEMCPKSLWHISYAAILV